MKGTVFQLKVWKYLKTIPKGKVKTYKPVSYTHLTLPTKA